MTAPNYDYDTQNADLQRRQRILDAMAQQVGAPIESQAGPGVSTSKASMLTGLSKIVSAFLGNKNQDALNQEKSTLTNRYQADGRVGLEKLIEGISATPGMQPAVGAPDGGQGANNPSAYVAPSMQTPQDVSTRKRQAIIEAMGSNHPMLQQLGASQLSALGKDQLTTKDMLPYAAPAAIPGMITGGVGAFKPKADLGEVGGVVYDKGTLEVKQLKDGYKGGSVTINGDTYQPNPSTGKLEKMDNAPKVTVNNIPAPGQKAATEFEKSISKARADALVKSYDTAKDLPGTLVALEEAGNALKAGIHSGQLGEVSLTLSKLGESIGFGRTDPAIANTEEFRSKMANSVLAKIASLKPASDKDVEYAKQAGGADLKLAAQAMERLIDSARAASYTTLVQHDKLLQRNLHTSGAIPEDLETFRVPFSFKNDPSKINDNKDGTFSNTAPAVGAGEVVPLADYLNRLKKK